MNLKLKNKEWETFFENARYKEYINDIEGAPVISNNDFKFDTIKPIISLNRKESTIDIFSYPWKNGEKVPGNKNLVPVKLRYEIENIVKKTDFYFSLLAQMRTAK